MTHQAHAAYGSKGKVVQLMGNDELLIRLDEAVGGTRDGRIPRRYVTRDGYNLPPEVAPNRLQQRRSQMLDCVKNEMRMEINRIKQQELRAMVNEVHTDRNGNNIYLGDLVHIEDERHVRNGWVCMVDSFTADLRRMFVKLGMPPLRLRQPSELDEEARRNRPTDDIVEVYTDQTRLVRQPVE